MENGYENWVWLAFTHYKEVAATSTMTVAIEWEEPSMELKQFPHTVNDN